MKKARSSRPAVLLISPGILKWTDMDFGLPHLVSMGSWLEEHTGVRVQLLDLNYEGGDHDQLRLTIDELGPFVLIGLSCYSSFDYRRVMSLAAFLAEAYPSVPLVTGGYHASARPGDLDFEGSPFDAVVVGEGERPLQRMVEELLGGEGLQSRRYGPDLVPRLDDLPPSDWSLLDRYWSRAHSLGKKFQIVLSRGCPYRCTFCMERAKTGYSWRAFSPERALQELEALSRHTELGRWVVNIADPLFGYQRRWRREVLGGIVERGLLPRAYWTLTRSDDLDEPDFELLGAARFSIGIGLESGSPRMLRWMQKGNTPERYLAAVKRLAARSRVHGITWAVNVIVGHPGETPETLEETGAFVSELFSAHEHTRGWLSVDPFRLYPGSAVAEQQADWEARFGSSFHSPRWWTGWYDLGFHAQHVDPSSELDHDDRVRAMHRIYAPLLDEISHRFVGQGRDVDRVYTASIRGQQAQLAPERLEQTLELSRRARARGHRGVSSTILRVPLGLRIKDPWVRRREQAIRRLLDGGVLRSEALVEALLAEGPERWMPEDAARAVLEGKHRAGEHEGLPAVAIGVDTVATALESLEAEAGMVVAQLAAGSAWVAAVLARLVGAEGKVLLTHLPRDGLRFRRLPQGVHARESSQDALLTLGERVDRIWIGAALPRAPRAVRGALRPGGRLLTALGPRFRQQDLVRLDLLDDGTFAEHRLGRVRLPVLAGRGGWLSNPGGATGERPQVSFVRREAPELAYRVLGRLDLGADAANLSGAREGSPPVGAPAWTEGLLDAYHSASGRLALQVHALGWDRAAPWLESLEQSPPGVLRDEAGLRLVRLFLAACRETLAGEAWPGVESPGIPREVEAQLGPALERLRTRLWRQQGTPPPLVVVDCPSLGHHGRATTVGGVRVVGVSLREDPGHLLCQILHEDMHAITDPIVLREHSTELAGVPRDTRLGSPGHDLHRALEEVAVGAMEAFLRARAPELNHDFLRWRGRFAPPSVAGEDIDVDTMSEELPR